MKRLLIFGLVNKKMPSKCYRRRIPTGDSEYLEIPDCKTNTVNEVAPQDSYFVLRIRIKEKYGLRDRVRLE